MNINDLMRQVRLIELKTTKLVSGMFAGMYMSSFKGRGIEFDEIREYEPGDDVRAIRSVVSTSVHTDEELKEAIVELDRRYAYVADPHTAIAYLGARPSGGVFLATAHPAKFGETVEATLGRPVETPAALVEAMGRPNLSKPIEPQLSELARYL